MELVKNILKFYLEVETEFDSNVTDFEKVTWMMIFLNHLVIWIISKWTFLIQIITVNLS